MTGLKPGEFSRNTTVLFSSAKKKQKKKHRNSITAYISVFKQSFFMNFENKI